MELRFIIPDLRRLDLAGTEVLAACVASDDRPPRGIPGLVDWRLSGRLAKLCLQQQVTGNVGEVVLLPGKPKLPFDKVLLFGIGEQAAFNEQTFRAVTGLMLETMAGLKVRNAVVELPGRATDLIAPERSADILLESARGLVEHDIWTLIEPTEAQRVISQRMVQERRRVRQL